MLSRSIVLFVTLVAVVTAAIVVSAAVAGAHALAPAVGAGSSGDCGATGYVWGYDIACQSGTVSPGTQARPASSPAAGVADGPACGLYPIAGNPGNMLQVCPDGVKLNGGRNGLTLINTVNTVVPVGGGAAVPQVTPQQLLAWAQAQLKLPLPGIKTAPPHGSEGLVGLPEWFWVDPAQWHPVTTQVAVGTVWAQVTASPVQITIRPGAGDAVTCDGPGTAYDPKLPAQSQHSDCTWTYGQSSDGLPGNAYQASVTVTWDATWSGAGGAGGALAPDEETAAFAVPVAEAQSLTPSGS
jgi:hypothetical protein